MRNEEQSWGLNALGVADSFEVSLHEGIGQEAWELEFVCDMTTIAFYINSPDVAVAIYSFIKENYGKTCCRTAKKDEYPGIQKGTLVYREVASLDVSSHGLLQVHLSKCGESPDRFNFVMSSKNHRCHIVLDDPHTSRLVSALKDLISDIENG